jgi:hypothetical protein
VKRFENKKRYSIFPKVPRAESPFLPTVAGPFSFLSRTAQPVSLFPFLRKAHSQPSLAISQPVAPGQRPLLSGGCAVARRASPAAESSLYPRHITQRSSDLWTRVRKPSSSRTSPRSQFRIITNPIYPLSRIQAKKIID